LLEAPYHAAAGEFTGGTRDYCIRRFGAHDAFLHF
jgi:hypothetical protein